MYVGDTLFPMAESHYDKAKYPCSFCCKEDVCFLKEDMINTVDAINETVGDKKEFISSFVQCKKSKPLGGIR